MAKNHPKKIVKTSTRTQKGLSGSKADMQSDTANAFGGTCVYYCAGNQWWPIGGNPSPGYYCPSTPTCGAPGPCTNGQTIICSASSVSMQASTIDQFEFFTEYLIQDGNCFLAGGRAPEGMYCAPDLITYSRDSNHDDLISLSSILLQLSQRGLPIKITLPWNASIAKCAKKNHNAAHANKDEIAPIKKERSKSGKCPDCSKKKK